MAQVELTIPPECVCLNADPYVCWALRSMMFNEDGYSPNPEMDTIIEADGGPCQCACHDEDELEELDAS